MLCLIRCESINHTSDILHEVKVLIKTEYLVDISNIEQDISSEIANSLLPLVLIISSTKM